MAAISASITKIRRLVKDVNNPKTFSDAWILIVFGRIQQDFCRKSLAEKEIYLIKAPPNIEYAFSHMFEEGYLDGFAFSPFQRTGTSVASQPWELETDYTGDTTGGNTHTNGTGIPYYDPQHRIPFPLPDSVYNIQGLLWDYKAVEYESIEQGREHKLDAWKEVADVVDFFSMEKAWRKKSFVTHSTPSTVQSSGTNQASQVGEDILADAFYVFSNEVPDRPTATTDTIAVHDPFQKYIEFGVASILLEADTQKASPLKAQHYKARYEIGIELAKRVLRKAYGQKRRVQGPKNLYRLGDRPPRPRLPDHYPSLRA